MRDDVLNHFGRIVFPMQNSRFPFLPYIAGVVLLALLWFASATFGIPIRHLTADPAQIYKSPFYNGFLSNLTVITWAMGAYGALFAAWFVKRWDGDREWVRFFRMAGIFTLVLMLDDLFMFHEEIFPKYGMLSKLTGIEPNEKIVIGCYGLFAMWFVYSSRHTLRKTAWLQLLVACVILAFGVMADRGIAKKVFTDSATRAFVEDAAKFLGVLGWSLYFISTAKAVVGNHMQGGGAGESDTGSSIASSR